MCARHPDKNVGNTEEAEQRFKEINAAYQRIVAPPDESDEEDEEMFYETAFDIFHEIFG